MSKFAATAKLFVGFVRNEDGVATSEFVVLTAGAVALAVSVVTSMADSTGELADSTSSSMVSLTVASAAEGTETEVNIEEGSEDADTVETEALGDNTQAATGTPGADPTSGAEDAEPESDVVETASADPEPSQQSGQDRNRGWLRNAIAFLARLFGMA